MAKQKEGKLSANICKTLRKKVGGWWQKIWQGPFSSAGIPDILGCVDGQFYAFETKRGRNELEPIQVETIKRLRAAGAVACEVRSVAEAIAIVEATRPVPTRAGGYRLRNKDVSNPIRSRDREDIRSRRDR